MPIDIQKVNLDSILTHILLRRLVAPVTQTKAYKLKLVDNTGKVLRNPETDDEKNNLTILDRVIFKLKRMLGSKMGQLNNYLYILGSQTQFMNKLIVKGSIDQRAEIMRMKNDIKKIQEKYEIDTGDMFLALLTEEINETSKTRSDYTTIKNNY